MLNLCVSEEQKQFDIAGMPLCTVKLCYTCMSVVLCDTGYELIIIDGVCLFFIE